MFKKITTSGILIATIFLTGVSAAYAGSLTPPGAPANTMYTMTDIFNLSVGTTATLGSGTIQTTPASVTASFKTLTEIYDAIVAQIANLSNPKIANGITAFGFTGTLFGDTDASKVLSTATYPGTIAVKTADNAVTDGTVSGTSLLITPPTGYYDGTATVSTTSAALIAGNIKSGVNLFGIPGSLTSLPYGDASAAKVLTIASSAGTYNAANLSAATVKSGTSFGVSLTGDYPSASNPLPGDTAATDAVAAGILATQEAWTKTGALITGLMPTNTLTTANDTVSAGYYAATTLHAVDSNLAAGNIKSGTSIFGIAGAAPSAGLLKTNQTICYDTSGAVVTCGSGTGAGQDGAYGKGIARSFHDNNDSTITDNNTGLMWEKCLEGLSGAGCTTGSATTYTWALALTQCENSTANGHDDWRLPNVYELYSLVDFGGVGTLGPVINLTYFPATVSSIYWSSTTDHSNKAYAMFVSFSVGSASSNPKTNSFYVRCVRGG